MVMGGHELWWTFIVIAVVGFNVVVAVVEEQATSLCDIGIMLKLAQNNYT